MTKTALLVFGIKAKRVGGIEVYCHETAMRLHAVGWKLVLCFDDAPSPEVREYLSLPNVIWEQLPTAWCNSAQALRDLRRIVKKYRPDIVHLQFTPFLSLNAWIARISGARRILFTDHGSHPAGFKAARQPLWKRLAAHLLNAPVKCAITVSDFNAAVMTTLGTIPAKRVRRVYNGIDLAGCAPSSLTGAEFRARYGIAAERVLVTQVSWIIPEKGITDVLEAARVAIAEEPRLHFAFVGDGKYLKEYSDLAAAYGIADHVTWTGLVKNPMAEGVFSATDISCQASRWQEAFGLVIAEAMACGRPVVATNVGGIPELVEDNVTGFLIPRGDIAALAQKFVLLARDAALRERLGRAGRKRAEADFDVRKNVALVLDLYGEL